jgi:hypothetical protein
MTRWSAVKDLNEEEFRRLTGVKPEVFEKMRQAVQDELDKSTSVGGRKYKLILEDRILLTLEYLSEYRTHFHISVSYGISETTVRETVNFIEGILVKHKDFALPGRKALLMNENEFEVVLVDVTESPVERPKKSKSGIIPGKRNGTH